MMAHRSWDSFCLSPWRRLPPRRRDSVISTCFTTSLIIREFVNRPVGDGQ
jgi:hypothetical protein